MRRSDLYEIFYGVIAIGGLFVLLDYFITALQLQNSFFTNHKYISFLNSFPGRYGIIIRLFFLSSFFVLIWYTYKFNVIKRKLFYTTEGKVLISVVSLIIFIVYTFINILPQFLLPYLYPVVVVLSIISMILFSTSFSMKELITNDKSDIKAEKKRKTSDLGFSLPSADGYINIPNPFRGIFVVAGAGSGKSDSIAIPIIYQAVKNRYSGVLYDFKFNDPKINLTRVAYSAFLHYNITDIDFKIINFTDFQRSYRCNPIHPDNIPMIAYADEYSQAIFNNLFPREGSGGKFFDMSAIQVLKASIWFFKEEYPEYCTLPHVVNMILEASTEELISILESNDETSGMISAAKVAAASGAGDQLAGVIGQLKMVIEKINTKEICWVLNGNDVSLDLNNKDKPTFLCIGSHSQLNSSLGPVIALITTVCMKMMNMADKHHSVLLLDEFPTLYIPNIEEYPNTARSNYCSTVLMCQDFAQIEDRYGRIKQKSIIASLANQFYGNCNNLETTEYISKLFGKIERVIVNRSQSASRSTMSDSASRSVNYNIQEKVILKPQDVMTLLAGHFVGKVVESDITFFNTRLKRLQDEMNNYHIEDIPTFAKGSDINENYNMIKKDVREIIGKHSNKSKIKSFIEN
ncbi:MAG: type IV secretory system conjugative DNA transfer family protein [Bacteroidota bacterium]